MKEDILNIVESELFYGLDNGVMPVNETSNSVTKIPTFTGSMDPRIMPINNGRKWDEPFDIEIHGFELVPHKTEMVDFLDTKELKEKYYKELKTMVKQHVGASDIYIFDHTLRTGDDEKRKKELLREPVKRVHNDYTEWSGPQRVRDLFPKEAEKLISRRFSIIQVWRPIQKILDKDPLALCDARSVEESDLIITERRYPDRVGQTYQIKYNTNHEWFYFPKMTRDEAIIFRVYDSEVDGRARFTPHTSFIDPQSTDTANERESIEVRMMAFF